MPKTDFITQARIKEILNYNSNTGFLTWTVSRSSRCIAGAEINGRRKDGYVCIGIDGVLYRAHRIIWLLSYGEMPDEIDHINGIRDDNRLCNLRSVTRQENAQNSRLKNTNANGINGVHFYKRTENWMVAIYFEYEKIHLGYFDNFFDACCARKSAEIKYGFHSNHGK